MKKIIFLFLALIIIVLCVYGNYGEGFKKILPEASELVGIPMGTTEEEKQIDYIKVRIPENYTICAAYHDGAFSNTLYKMADGDDIVKDAIGAGLLKQEKSPRYFYITNSELSEKETKMTCMLYSSDEFSYELIKAQSGGYTEIGETGAFYYITEDGERGNILSLCYPVTEDMVLLLDYEGPVMKEKETGKIAEQLYNLIELIEQR